MGANDASGKGYNMQQRTGTKINFRESYDELTLVFWPYIFGPPTPYRLHWEYSKYIWVCSFFLFTVALTDSASRNMFLKNFENFKGLF